MLKKSIALSTLLHVSVGAALFFLFILQHPPIKPKVVSITFVALPTHLHVEQKKIESQLKQSVQKPLLVKQQEVKQPPLPVQESKPIVKQEEIKKTVETKPIETKTLEKPKEVIKETPPQVKKVEPTLASAESKNIKNRYLGIIYQSIDKLKVYPKNAKRLGQSGTAKVTFTVLADGTITNISLKDSSGFATLDDAAKKILITLAKTAPIPKELNEQNMSITVPIVYKVE
ncbi:MAG: energy transducer TonB [Thiovulaceae bacterium]|nr:energy transducer TonB [Sulfurimonadaceae bacterium]